MNIDQGPSITCTEIRALLPAFLSDEIPLDQSGRIHAHLEVCASCTRYRRLESAFDETVRRSVKRKAAPPSLIVRIHEALNEEDRSASARLRRFMAPGWRRWAAAAALLAAVLLPGGLAYQAGILRLPGAPSEVEQVIRGTLVCGTCERKGIQTRDQRGCRAFGHHTAFRCPKTGLWDFVESDVTRPLLTDADRVGDPVEVRGVFFTNLHYIKVTSYTYLTSTPEQASGL